MNTAYDVHATLTARTGSGAVRFEVHDKPGVDRVPMGSMLGRPLWLRAAATEPGPDTVDAPRPVLDDRSPGSPWWDDYAEARVQLDDGRVLDLRIFEEPAPGRLPMSGHHLFLEVEEPLD